MANPQQRKKADAFRQMHHGPAPLLLVNVWDAASARIIEAAGSPALATSSAGIAFALGYPDGEKIPRQEMLDAVARIARSVEIPVTADVEACYGSRPEDAEETASGVIAAGAIGMNFEDATGDATLPLADVSRQVERIRAIRDVAVKRDVPLVLNARTDVYLLQVGDPANRYDETLRRLRAYRDAGADCLFAPGLRDAPTIRRLVADLQFPVNILAGPGLPAVADLAALGVKRISLGSGPMRAGLGLLRRIGNELKTEGTYKTWEQAPSHAEMNTLMNRSFEAQPES
jgi:2-methylisocitrate lyase-like PEP mutase family enzyme